MSYCIKCIIKGRVQGVFYRDTTRTRARELGLAGHAYNLMNGDVEVVACGKEAKVKQLQEWLWQGPEHADVIDVLCEEVDGDVEGGFVIG
ncbi:MAG: acylphosphatase [Gammaproteobacteria bacterium]|jgi:acylphosphatase